MEKKILDGIFTKICYPGDGYVWDKEILLKRNFVNIYGLKK